MIISFSLVPPAHRLNVPVLLVVHSNIFNITTQHYKFVWSFQWRVNECGRPAPNLVYSSSKKDHATISLFSFDLSLYTCIPPCGIGCTDERRAAAVTMIYLVR